MSNVTQLLSPEEGEPGPTAYTDEKVGKDPTDASCMPTCIHARR